MQRQWAMRLLWLAPFVLGCKSVSGPPDDALLLNRHPIDGRPDISPPPLVAYHEPTPPTVPWNPVRRADLADDAPTRRPRAIPGDDLRTVPGVLTNRPKAMEEPKLPDY